MLEPILVRPRGQPVPDHRGRAALSAPPCEAGLAEIPCIVRETSDAEMMELALIENLQRKDLSAFEEADGLKVLAETYGYTHETMAEKLGKSRTSITETLSLTAMPEDVRELCRLADIQSKSLLLQIVRQSDPQKMMALIERLQKEGTTTRQAARDRIAKAEAQEPNEAGRGTTSSATSRGRRPSACRCSSARADVPREEIVRALQAIIEEL